MKQPDCVTMAAPPAWTRTVCRSLAVIGMAGIWTTALGQSSRPPGNSPARLRDLEATYQQELRRIQVPLLTEYAARLEQLAAVSTPAETPAIRSEIARVKKLITEGGVVDLRMANAALAGAPPTPPPAGPKSNAPPSLVLEAAQASNFVPTGENPPAIALGEAAWTVPQIREGSYDLIVQYACTGVTEPAIIRISIGDHEFDFDLQPNKVTREASQFRLMRIGRLKIDRDLPDTQLRVGLKADKSVVFRLRQLIITEARPKPE